MKMGELPRRILSYVIRGMRRESFCGKDLRRTCGLERKHLIRRSAAQPWKFGILAVFLTACAPGLGSSLKVGFDAQPEVTPLMVSVAGNPPSIQVLKFVDARAVEAIAQIDGRIIKPSSDLGLVVQRALEQALQKNGIRLAAYDAAVIRGEIREWNVTVTPGFPSTALEAKSSIIIELFEIDGTRRIHRAQYSGVYGEEHPFIGESDVSAALNRALDIAIKESLSDPIFINKISTLHGLINRQPEFQRDDDLY